LKSQFINSKTRLIFLEQLSKLQFPNEEELNFLREDIKQQESKYKEVLDTSENLSNNQTNFIHEITKRYEEVQHLRTQLRSELEEVKTQFKETPPSTEFLNKVPTLQHQQEDQQESINESYTEMNKWYSQIYQQLSSLGGINIKDITDDGLIISLHNTTFNSIHELLIMFDPENLTFLDAKILPSIPCKDIINQARNSNDIQYLVIEVQNRIRNINKKKQEIANLINNNNSPTINWVLESTLMTISIPSKITVTLDVPYEYPNSWAKLRILKVETTLSQSQEVQDFLNPLQQGKQFITLTTLIEELNKKLPQT